MAELLDRISSAEVSEWKALFRLENEEAAEAERQMERAGRGPSDDAPRPTLGGADAIAAIEAARRREGLE